MAFSTYHIRTFCGHDKPGALQIIHLFSDENQMLHTFETAQICDEFDHTFAYTKHDGKTLVRWRNKSGEIETCGSGAFALLSLLRQSGNLFTRLHTQKGILASHEKNGELYLQLPLAEVAPLSTTDAGKLFIHQSNGIYLLETKSLYQLECTDWLNHYLPNNSFSDIHGFCTFYWDRISAQGALRYFVPWHGRDEDYVTGSIHQYLTPLIETLYQPELQYWIQSSSSPGIMTSYCDIDKVYITGQCKIVKHENAAKLSLTT